MKQMVNEITITVSGLVKVNNVMLFRNITIAVFLLYWKQTCLIKRKSSFLRWFSYIQR